MSNRIVKTTQILVLSDNNQSVLASISFPEKEMPEEELEAFIIVEDNSIRFSIMALALLKANIGSKVEIKYSILEDNSGIPVIGLNSVFGTEGGNAIRANLSMAFKGFQNEELRKYGRKLYLYPTNTQGIFNLYNIPFTQEVKEPEVNTRIYGLSEDYEFTDEDNNIKEFDLTFFK